MKVKYAWNKFRELQPIITKRGASLKIKGTIYRACVKSVLVYGTETWAMKVDDMERLESMMVRQMCDVSLKDIKSSIVLLERLSVKVVPEVDQPCRLHWHTSLQVIGFPNAEI